MTPRQGHDDGSTWRSRLAGRVARHRRAVLLVVASVVGVVIFSWLKARFDRPGDGELRAIRAAGIDAGLAISGACLVGLVVGFVIDRAARERLAEKLAESWLWGILGRDAPPQIQQRAKEILEERVILSMALVTVRLEWVDPDRTLLRLGIRSLQTGTNYGPEPFRVQPSTKLIPSTAGHASRVTRWEFEVYPHDQSQEGQHVVFLEEDLAGMAQRDDDGVVAALSASDLQVPEEIAARRGDKFRLLRCAEMVLGASDCFPVSLGRPALDYTLVLTGPAYADLVVDVLTSRPDGADFQDAVPERDGARYAMGAALGVEWMWACWHRAVEPAGRAAAAPAAEPAQPAVA